MQRAVSIPKDEGIESGSHECVFEASLEEKLGDEALKLSLSGEFGDADGGFVHLHPGFDLGDRFDVAGDAAQSERDRLLIVLCLLALALSLGPCPGIGIADGGIGHALFRVPFQFLPPLQHGFVGQASVVGTLLRHPHVGDGVGKGVAEPGIDMKVTGFGKKSEGGGRVRSALSCRSQKLEDGLDEVAVRLVFGTVGLGRCEIDLETRFDEAIVADVPHLAVPCGGLASRVKKWNGIPQKVASRFL